MHCFNNVLVDKSDFFFYFHKILMAKSIDHTTKTDVFKYFVFIFMTYSIMSTYIINRNM